MAQEDRNFKRESSQTLGMFYQGEKADPVYRKRRNGLLSRANAQRISKDDKLIGKKKRQLIKRDTRKRVEEEL